MNSSKYNVFVEYKDKVLLYNSINNSFSCFKNDENKDEAIGNFFNSQIAKNKGYVFEDNYDEDRAFLMKLQDNSERRFLNLVILPTMQCNFICPYCYESKTNDNMQLETIKALENFISIHLYEYSGLHISWFGGEPLLRMDIIERINKKAQQVSKKLGKVFFSSITTNGYLLTTENFSKLLSLDVKDFTVTLDGTRAYHDKFRKLHNDLGTYNVLIDNINKIKEIKETFNFTIRMNVNKENFDNLDNFIDEMYNYFGLDSRFDLALVLTSDWGGQTIKYMENDLLSSSESLYDIIIANKNKFKFKNMFQLLEGATCKFSNRHSYVVDTKGNLLKCTVYLKHEKAIVGKILPSGKLEFNYNNLSFWNLHNNFSNDCSNCKMSLLCKGKYCIAVDDYKKTCGYSIEKLNKMIIAKYELEPDSFYCVN